MKKLTKKERERNLVNALIEHRQNPPAICHKEYGERLAIRHGVNKKTMHIALHELARTEGI